MKCQNCQSETNKFPLYPEMFENHLGWCMPCIAEDNRYRYQWLQSNGVFLKLRDLMNDRDEGRISQVEFDLRKTELFKI